MTAIIRSRPWATQPQIAIGIDWNNPITRSLAFAFNPAIGFTDSVKSSRSVTTRGGVGLGASSSGMGFKSSSNATVGASFTGSRLSTSTGDGAGDFTVLVMANPVASATREVLYSTTNGTTEFYFIANATVGIVASAGMISPQTNSGGAIGLSQTGGADGMMHTWAYRRAPSLLERSLFCDGVSVAYAAGSTPNQMWASNSADTLCGYTSGSYGISKSLVTAIGFNRALSDAEIKSLSNNIWQIFNPRVT